MVRSREHVRYRYGICLNEKCSKSRDKVVQKVSARGDLICDECQKPLRECPPPSSGPNKRLIGIVCGVLVLAAVVVGGIFLFGGKTEHSQESTAMIDSINAQRERDSLQRVADSLAQLENEKNAKKKESKSKARKAQQSVSNRKDLGYAVFVGTVKNGQLDDVNGRLTFKSSHIIDSRDPKGRVAEPGDYVIGEFSEGHLVQGIWYDSNNVVKGSIIIGK